MYSQPQDGAVRRSRWSALLALTLAAGGLSAGQAWGDIQVHVMNCTSNEIEFQAFDSKDSVEEVAASTKKLSDSGETASLHCAGEGRGYCQMVLAILEKPVACANADSSSGIAGSSQFHLDSDKWAVVTGYETEKNGSDVKCKPVIELNLDSASCD